ncbi:LysM peptidoglycan-binding domain-containing protein [Weissella cibaria]|uniref:C40 family peptidase n=1 Tax=Weissella cibaria TaxID=137591 RepID=UPI0011952CCF|nr:C40 family peptidase [Weissella cibaria]TVV24453.1 LysM peptidoglycan-binding domain-containing protein [Weissella cibaria]
MGQTPTKAIIAGVAGALGVVATTQVPMVQAAVDQLANMTQDTKHVKRVSTANDAEKLKSAHRGVTKKSDIVRAQSTSTTPQFEAVADEIPVEPSLAPVLETNSHAEIAATSEVDTPTSLSVADDVLQSTAQVTASYVYTAPSASETSTMVSSAPATPAEQAVVSEATTATASPADATRYTVQDGDTLGNIATTIGVPVETIIALNPDVDLTMLQVGQIIFVPRDTVPVSEVTSPVTIASDAATSVSEVTADDYQTALAAEVADAMGEDIVVETPSMPSSAPTIVVSSATDTSTSTSVAASSSAAGSSAVASSVAPTTPVDTTVDNTVPSTTPTAVLPVNPGNETDVVSGSLTATQRQTIVAAALKYAGQGIPYVWGGKTPAGFDCSGLAAWVYQDAGLSLPSYTVSEESYVATTDVRTKADVMAVAQPGDLLFWGGHGASWHVAIYIGGGQYVAAPAPGKNVQIETVDEVNFMPNFIGSYNI